MTLARTPMDARQRGQAMTEFVVMALVLVPLFLLIPVIAKYQDIAHATQMASRYVAFEATTRNDNSINGFKTPAELAGEVQRRFFSNASAAIKTGDTAGDFAAHRKPFWVDQHGDPLVKKFSDVGVSFGEANGADHNDAYVSAKDGEPFEINLFNVRDELGLKAPGLYRANVSVKLADLPSAAGSFTKAYDTFNAIGLSMTRSTTVLVDGWAAKDSAQVESRIKNVKLVPGTVFADGEPLEYVRKAADAAVGLIEMPAKLPSPPCTKDCGPRLGDLEFWRDTVPNDRLK